MENKMNKKLGYKFFWFYLILGGLKSLMNISDINLIIGRVENIWLKILYGYEAIIYLMFIVMAIMFMIAVRSYLCRLYRTAYYVLLVYLCMVVVDSVLGIILACQFSTFYTIPTFALNLGWCALVFLYFRKRQHLQNRTLATNIEVENANYINKEEE